MKIGELIERLRLIGSGEPQAEAYTLIDAIFGFSRADMLLDRAREYDNAPLLDAITRREHGEPLQYITGRAYFYNCIFKVTPDCLIPRADTEILCELIIKHLPRNAHFLELCSGSGCIPIAVLKERNDLTCESIELYPATVALADENRRLNDISSERLKFVVGDALSLDTYTRLGKYDAIVSNPPYIPSGDIATLSREVLNEPRAALDGGADGLVFYRHFLKHYADMLRHDGFFAFEIGYDQATAMHSLCDELSYSCRIGRDYGGNDRTAMIRPQR